MTDNKKFDITKHIGIISSLIAILAGMIVAFIILMISKPSNGVQAFLTLISGGMYVRADIVNLGNVLYYATPILCTGVAMCLAFQAGVFNIGGPGQYTTGAFVAILAATAWGQKLPAPLSFIIPIVLGMIMGALWAAIPGILKAYFNVNVIVSTTMFNYICMYYIVYLVRMLCYDQLKGQTKPVVANAKLPKGFLAGITNNSSADIGIFFAIAAAIIVWFILEKTKLGYELKACGKNAEASRYAGIKSKTTIVASMLLSGALCGLGGALNHLSQAGVYIKVAESIAAEGFTGIAVCCLANNNPIGAIFGALYMAYITVGGQYMQLYGFQKEIVDVITSVIVYFAAFSPFLGKFIETRISKKKVQQANAAAKSEEASK
ncbi:MAG: ABC transporter permease [Erysipelotrichaceae bacterium]|nr:ABC transporter permease [Erysipelotrichaceae bacterium]